MATVKHLLESKGKTVWSVTPNAKTHEALKLMSDKDVGALPVVDGDKLVGIISERDFARRLAEAGEYDKNRPVREFMITNVYYANPENTTEECMKLMTNKHIRHLPILVNGKMVGLITIGDLVKEIISNQQSTIKSLENFITGQNFEL